MPARRAVSPNMCSNPRISVRFHGRPDGALVHTGAASVETGQPSQCSVLAVDRQMGVPVSLF